MRKYGSTKWGLGLEFVQWQETISARGKSVNSKFVFDKKLKIRFVSTFFPYSMLITFKAFQELGMLLYEVLTTHVRKNIANTKNLYRWLSELLQYLHIYFSIKFIYTKLEFIIRKVVVTCQEAATDEQSQEGTQSQVTLLQVISVILPEMFLI